MPVVVELQNTGDFARRSELIALIEHTLCERVGDWRVVIVGSYGNDNWELKIRGPKGFERMYTLDRSAGEHDPQVVRSVLLRLIST